uniref:Fe2OG dioxygenase domain-containing protein n=1 Tax=Amphora coffeiformis TaxID=265554 RepID=A0A7S3KY71_9STRA
MTNSKEAGGGEPVMRRRACVSQRRRDGLLRFAKDKTSQSGEDGIIERIFTLLPPPPDGRPYWCVDVGAWDGRHLSNTFSLLVPDDDSHNDNKKDEMAQSSQQQVWRGVLIEADVERFQELSSLHSRLGNICLNVSVSGANESPHSLVHILSQVNNSKDACLPRELDFLCIDIDGSDYWVMEGVLGSSKFRPRVICVEFNPTMPDDLIYIPARNDTIRHGASLSALVELAEKYDYTLVETTLYNAFFVETTLHRDHLRDEVPDTSIEALHEPTMGTSLYQLYDGTIKLWGCKRMLWHRIPMDEKKMQLISAEERQFPFAPAEQDTFDKSMAIDLSPFYDSTLSGSSEREKCTQGLWSQLQRDGFAYVRGLPIHQELALDALGLTNDFLQSADESVRRSCLTKDRARRGYSPMNTENFASLVGDKGPNDLVRKFRVGPEGAAGSSALWQPNIWPSPDDWEQALLFRDIVQTFYNVMADAAQVVVKAICDALLSHDPNLVTSLRPLTENDALSHTSILTLLGYQIGTRHRGKNKGPLVAPHTDVGVVTILLFDQGDCATLQRSDDRGGWVDVDLPKSVPADPIFVVNVADCLASLTGGKLPSTLHRVATRPGTTPRNCCALFVGLDPTQILEVDGESMTYEEWRKLRIARAQNVLRGDNIA